MRDRVREDTGMEKGQRAFSVRQSNSPQKKCIAHLISKKCLITLIQPKQDDQGNCSILTILTHVTIQTGSEGSRVIMASVVAIWATATVGKHERRTVHTVERLGTENSICLGFLLQWSISTPTSTRVIADTCAFSHCRWGREQCTLSFSMQSSAEYTPKPLS